MDNLSIHKLLTDKFGGLQQGTLVVENFNDFKNAKIIDGILLVFAGWSGSSIVNLISTLNFVYEFEQTYSIFILDIDSVTTQEQTEFFGQTLEGWGEIFVLRNGTIYKSYFGRDGAKKFQTDFRLISDD